MTPPGVGDALLVVDVQLDFLPGGSLAVPAGGDILSPLNRALDGFAARLLPVFASRDWHPPEHCSFVPQGGPWPVHCVAGTRGASFPYSLHLPANVGIVSKGCALDQDAYSAFGGTDLDRRLRAAGVQRLFVAGLATDYCVQASVLDARRLGYGVVVLRDAVAAVELHPGDGERALQSMVAAGAVLADSRLLWA